MGVADWLWIQVVVCFIVGVLKSFLAIQYRATMRGDVNHHYVLFLLFAGLYVGPAAASWT